MGLTSILLGLYRHPFCARVAGRPGVCLLLSSLSFQPSLIAIQASVRIQDSFSLHGSLVRLLPPIPDTRESLRAYLLELALCDLALLDMYICTLLCYYLLFLLPTRL